MATVAEQAQKSTLTFLAMLASGPHRPCSLVLSPWEKGGAVPRVGIGLCPGSLGGGASSGCPSRQNQLQQAAHMIRSDMRERRGEGQN